MLNRRLTTLTSLFCTLSLAALAPTLAEEEVDDTVADSSKSCIDTRRISQTHVADAENILFYMRGGDIYVNRLPRKCMSLAREKKFSYRTSNSRLCDLDTIRVLYNMGGGLTQGAGCGLGKFYAITEEEAKAVRAGPDTEIEAEPIEPADMEQPEVAPPQEKSEE